MSKIYIPKTKLAKWFDQRLPIARFIYEHILTFSTPRNLNYFYTFGSILLFMLASQIFSGIIMAMHYVPHIDMAFSSKEYMRRTINYGWLFTASHSVGASFFFIAAYIHIARGLYYGSYKPPREMVWFLGIFIYFIMMIIAFTGCVLSYSMMSTTAIIVISNFIEHIPFIGTFLNHLLLGGFVVGQPTLNHLYIFHIILPFILCLFIFLHIWSIHISGQSNPLGIEVKTDKDLVPFAPYVLLKDVLAVSIFALIFAVFVFYMPDIMQSNESFIAGNPDMITNHIAPEWYFLPFYSMLRAMDFDILYINSAFAGVIVVFSAFAILFFIPYLDRSHICSARFRPIYRIFFWLFICNMILLGYLGNCNITPFVINLSKLCTSYYFIFFLIIMPFIKNFEKQPVFPNSIYEDVKAKKSRARINLW